LAHNCIIRLEGVGVAFPRQASLRRGEPFWALENVSFDVREGETLGVIGRNGAGKTTLLKVLAGILKPDRGILINTGHRVAMLSLQLGFLPNLDGRDNAMLSGILMGLTRAQVRARLDRIIAFAELGDFIDEPVATYSAGMRARLGFAVALECNPDVVLIDEVLGVGDADFRAKSAAAIEGLIRSNKTVVLVSHNADTIEKLCERAVWIEQRVTRAQGEVADVAGAYRLSAASPPADGSGPGAPPRV